MSNKTIWQSYMSMTPRFRTGLGLAGLAVGGAGLYISDRLEELWPSTPEDIQPPSVHLIATHTKGFDPASDSTQQRS